MQVAGVSKVSGDLVVGRSLYGLGPHDIVSSEETFKQTLGLYTRRRHNQVLRPSQVLTERVYEVYCQVNYYLISHLRHVVVIDRFLRQLMFGFFLAKDFKKLLALFGFSLL